MKTWMPILLGAVVAAVTSVVVVTVVPPAPSTAPGAEVESARGAVDSTAREIPHLHARIAVLEGNLESLGTELEFARDRLTKLESVARGDIPRPEPDPSLAPEEAPGAVAEPDPEPDEGQVEAAAKSLAAKTRRQALEALQAVIDASEDYEKRQQQRIVQGVRDFAREVGLEVEVARAMAYSLIEVHRQSGDRFRATLEGRDLSRVTREDVEPLVHDMFDSRARAMEAHLEPKHMDVFREREALTRERYDEWMKLAFPSRSR